MPLIDTMPLSQTLLRVIIAVTYLVVSAMMPLLAWYIGRAETLANESLLPWRPFPPTIGWWLSFFFLSLFVLFLVLGFLVLISSGPIFWWTTGITVMIGTTALGLFFSFAKVEGASWEE